MLDGGSSSLLSASLSVSSFFANKVSTKRRAAESQINWLQSDIHPRQPGEVKTRKISFAAIKSFAAWQKGSQASLLRADRCEKSFIKSLHIASFCYSRNSISAPKIARLWAKKHNVCSLCLFFFFTIRQRARSDIKAAKRANWQMFAREQIRIFHLW